MERVGITAADRERIRRYLEKPPYSRDEDDLVPDTGDSTG